MYELRAWVLVVNHVHILIYPGATLSRITKAIKNFSAGPSDELLSRTGQQCWQEESFDQWVRSPEELENIARYIEEDPVAAGLVKRAEDWRWSSAFRDSG
jgi:REP element-mobilizing transposase RayT